jgi:hypothetical protein
MSTHADSKQRGNVKGNTYRRSESSTRPELRRKRQKRKKKKKGKNPDLFGEWIKWFGPVERMRGTHPPTSRNAHDDRRDLERSVLPTP